MRKYFQKFHASSSTAKLFFFILLLLVIVILASSGFYIQYKHREKPVQAAPVGEVSSQNEQKPKATSLAPADESTSSNEDKPHTSDKEHHRQQNKSLPPKHLNNKSGQSCTKQILKHSTIKGDAPWLNKGELKTLPGRDGFIERCNGKPAVTLPPVDQIVYSGLKPLSDTNSLISSIVDNIKNLGH